MPIFSEAQQKSAESLEQSFVRGKINKIKALQLAGNALKERRRKCSRLITLWPAKYAQSDTVSHSLCPILLHKLSKSQRMVTLRALG